MNKIIRFPTKSPSKESLTNHFDNEILIFFKKQKKHELYRLITIIAVLVLTVSLTILIPLWVSFYLYEIVINLIF